MTRRLAWVLILLCALFVAVPAEAAQGSGTCSVSPDPDPVGTPYTLTAVNLKPSTQYTAELNEPTHSTEHQKLYLVGTTDTSGTLTVSADYAGPRGIWTPGTVTAKIFEGAGHGVGGTQAQCSFTVT